MLYLYSSSRASWVFHLERKFVLFFHREHTLQRTTSLKRQFDVCVWPAGCCIRTASTPTGVLLFNCSNTSGSLRRRVQLFLTSRVHHCLCSQICKCHRNLSKTHTHMFLRRPSSPWWCFKNRRKDQILNYRRLYADLPDLIVFMILTEHLNSLVPYRTIFYDSIVRVVMWSRESRKIRPSPCLCGSS